MKNRKLFVPGAALAIMLGIASGYFMTAQADDAVHYPVGFRKWVHVKSTLVGPQHSTFEKVPCTKPCVGGIYHFYANEKALEGYRTGKFPEGSIIADEVLETRELPTVADVSVEGPRRGVGVMVKDTQRYAATGGWGYESFKGDSQSEGRLSAKEAKACYTCHMSRKEHDFVFTQYQE